MGSLLHLFKNLEPKDFNHLFTSAEQCLKVIADEKWQHGFICRKCGHTNYCSGKTPHSRRCTKCKTDESATAHTIFHRCRIPITDAFEIAWMVCGTPKISSYELSRRLDTRQMTCWKFKKRIMECLAEGSGFHFFDLPK
ncbi:MAG: hypothetical protein K0B15_01975 [Lentimicrobium sp.]|nr:hypothetical protein [Lentimicrobium sp.]